MWDHIINIHPSELLNTKTKKFKVNESVKKKVLHYNFYFFIFLKNMDNIHFKPNNILTNFLKNLTKYKNNYQ